MIGSSDNRVSYDGNGIATEFAYTFKILEKSDMNVLHVAADGTETLLTKDYYVDMEKSVVLYPGYAPGAEIPESERPPVLPVGERLVLYRQVPITQESALDKHWPFNVIEDGLDKLTIICQQIWDRLGRSFYVSESTSTNFNPKVPIEPGKTFRVNDDGTGFEVTEDPGKVIDGAKALLKQTTEQAEFAKEQADASSQSAVNAQNAATSVQKYKALWFDNVAAMKAEPSLTAESYVCTAGYYAPNDGGGASYLIRAKLESDTDDGGSLHELANGLVAELIIENGTVNVKQFGAVGDNSRNDSLPIQQSIKYLLNNYPLNTNCYQGGKGHIQDKIDRRTGTIFFPTGIYIVDNNIFNSVEHIRAGYVGFNFVGTNKDSSVLLLKTNGAESWFFYSDAISERYQKMLFRDLGFRSDDYRFGNFAHIYSTGSCKQFRFDHCKFDDLNRFMYTEGNGNADLNKVFECVGYFYGDVLTLNNSQSVQHDFIGSDISTYGHFIRLMKNGGGNVNIEKSATDFVYHDDFSPENGNFMFYADDDGGSGIGNMTFCFRDCRVEIEAYTRKTTNPPFGLVHTPSITTANKLSKIIFDNCNFVNGGTYTIDDNGIPISGSRSTRRIENAVYLGSPKAVTFYHCVLLKNFFFVLNDRNNLQSPPFGATLIFDNCFEGVDNELPILDKSLKHIYDRTTFTDSKGRVVIKNTNGNTTGNPTHRDIINCNLNWRQGYGAEYPAERLILPLFDNNTALPMPAGTSKELVITIPPNFYAFKIYINKPIDSESSSTNDYQIHIGSEDKSTIIASSALGPLNGAHTINLENIDLKQYSKLRIWATGDESISSKYYTGAFGYIEYA